jgi:hypothetical protein
MSRFTYAALARYPVNQRERILQDWLAQYAWEVMGSEAHNETVLPR